jgi:hypothetical protein
MKYAVNQTSGTFGSVKSHAVSSWPFVWAPKNPGWRKDPTGSPQPAGVVPRVVAERRADAAGPNVRRLREHDVERRRMALQNPREAAEGDQPDERDDQPDQEAPDEDQDDPDDDDDAAQGYPAVPSLSDCASPPVEVSRACTR